MKSILITGAAGFLGSHLAEYYLKNNFRVVGVDNYCTGSHENISYLKSISKEFYFFEHDINQANELLLNFIKANQISNFKYFFHLASPASPPHYQELALETMWANSLGLYNVLQLSEHFSARVIFSSTSEVYGDPEKSPQTETYWGHVNSFGERSCYDESKRFGEALIFSYNKKNNTSHGLVRIFNTYGPRMNPNDGRVVINFILQALNNQNLTVYGDGLQTRSFCYVSDLISGLAQYAESSLKQPVNLGNDQEFTILDLAHSIIKATHSKSKIIHLPLPSDDPKKRKPDLNLAKKLLSGWQPTTTLDEGIFHMTDWAKKFIT